jgi:hypothetical protein
MAIIFRGKTGCALCGQVLAELDDIVATSHFIGDPHDPLWPFSDAGMHRACFVAWPMRAQFVERFNRTVGEKVWGNGTRHEMTEDGTILEREV